MKRKEKGDHGRGRATWVGKDIGWEEGYDSELFVSKEIMDLGPLSNNLNHYTCIFIIG